MCIAKRRSGLVNGCKQGRYRKVRRVSTRGEVGPVGIRRVSLYARRRGVGVTQRKVRRGDNLGRGRKRGMEWHVGDALPGGVYISAQESNGHARSRVGPGASTGGRRG